MTSPPSEYLLFDVHYIVHQKVTNSWADMTPILSFTTIIPFPEKTLQKCYILCKFGYTPYSKAPPTYMNRNRCLLYRSPKRYLQLG